MLQITDCGAAAGTKSQGQGQGYLTNSTGNSFSRAVAWVSTKDVHSYDRVRSANNKYYSDLINILITVITKTTIKYFKYVKKL